MIKIFEVKNYTSWHANSYVLYDDHNCILIDPSHLDEAINEFVKDNSLTVKAVILTHGHFDHITAVDYYIEKYKCDFYMHWGDVKMLNDPYRNSSFLINKEIMCNSKPLYLEHRQVLNILDEEIEVIHTPYHTPGGICLYVPNEGILISGDSLFKGGTGRTDLPGGSTWSMFKSLNRIKILPKETKVYPGHGENTTIGEEFN